MNNLSRAQSYRNANGSVRETSSGAIDKLKDLAKSDEDLRAYRASGGANDGRRRY